MVVVVVNMVVVIRGKPVLGVWMVMVRDGGRAGGNVLGGELVVVEVVVSSVVVALVVVGTVVVAIVVVVVVVAVVVVAGATVVGVVTWIRVWEIEAVCMDEAEDRESLAFFWNELESFPLEKASPPLEVNKSSGAGSSEPSE